VRSEQHRARVVWFGEQPFEDVGAAQAQVLQEKGPGRRHRHGAPGTRLHPHHSLPHSRCLWSFDSGVSEPTRQMCSIGDQWLQGIAIPLNVGFRGGGLTLAANGSGDHRGRR
jgi:hypothetical protein